MATTSHLRQLNQWRIVRALMQLKFASRGELAKAAEMSQPTVGRIVDDLIAAGMVQEMDDPRTADASAGAARGRPTKMLSLDRNTPRFLGVQLGVRKTRFALLPTAPPETDRWDGEFPTQPSAAGWTQDLKKAIVNQPLKSIEGIIVSVPGVVNEQTSQILLSPNASWIEHKAIDALLKPVSSKPIMLIQEIRALAIGQYLSRPDVRDFLLVDLGSGVGAAVIVNGELFAGPLPISGELGHTPVIGNTRPCGCGAVGCVETLVSRDGLLASSRQAKGPSTWPALLAHLRKHGMPDWMHASLAAVATTIAGAVNVIGLRQVFLTGSVEELPAEIGDRLCHLVTAGALWSRFGTVTCEIAHRRRQAGMVAAAIERKHSAENP